MKVPSEIGLSQDSLLTVATPIRDGDDHCPADLFEISSPF